MLFSIPHDARRAGVVCALAGDRANSGRQTTHGVRGGPFRSSVATGAGAVVDEELRLDRGSRHEADGQAQRSRDIDASVARPLLVRVGRHGIHADHERALEPHAAARSPAVLLGPAVQAELHRPGHRCAGAIPTTSNRSTTRTDVTLRPRELAESDMWPDQRSGDTLCAELRSGHGELDHDGPPSCGRRKAYESPQGPSSALVSRKERKRRAWRAPKGLAMLAR